MNATCRSLALAAVLLSICTTPAAAEDSIKRPFSVGHRGLVQAAPENTLAAFRACLSLRVGFEFDVRRTKDGQLVVLHDPTVDRTTDGKSALAELTYDELRRLDAGAWFDSAFRGERVPRVDEFFELLAAHASAATLIAVDLKETGNGIEEAVVRLAEQRKVLDRLIFIGEAIQSADVRSRLRTASPKAQVARLAEATENIADIVDDKNADWVYVRFLPTVEDMRRVQSAGKRVFLAGPLVVGTEVENWTKAAKLGVDAILTDYPLELQRQLRQPQR